MRTFRARGKRGGGHGGAPGNDTHSGAMCVVFGRAAERRAGGPNAGDNPTHIRHPYAPLLEAPRGAPNAGGVSTHMGGQCMSKRAPVGDPPKPWRLFDIHSDPWAAYVRKKSPRIPLGRTAPAFRHACPPYVRTFTCLAGGRAAGARGGHVLTHMRNLCAYYFAPRGRRGGGHGGAPENDTHSGTIYVVFGRAAGRGVVPAGRKREAGRTQTDATRFFVDKSSFAGSWPTSPQAGSWPVSPQAASPRAHAPGWPARKLATSPARRPYLRWAR